MITGTITRVDRTNRLAYYVPDPVPSTVASLDELRAIEADAAWVGRDVPVEGCSYYFTDDGATCWGLAGPSTDQVLAEHFTRVPTITASGAVAADTDWDGVITGAAGSGLGVMVAVSGAAAGRSAWLRKTDQAILCGTSDALRFHARVLIDSLTNMAHVVGLFDNTIADSAFIYASVGAPWTLRVGSGGVTTDVPSATDLAVAWFDATILLAPAQGLAAFWINDDGPYTATTNVPTTTDTLQPAILAQTTGGAATKFIAADNVHVDAIYGGVSLPIAA